MNQNWTVANQSSNQVTCQVPMNFGKQLLADVFFGSRYSTPSVSYVQFNIAQIGDDVRVQGHAWLENQSAFGQVRQSPFTDNKTAAGIGAFLSRVGNAIQYPSTASNTSPPAAVPLSSATDADVGAGNISFVENVVKQGHCDVAQRFATEVNDSTLTAHVQTLCQAK